MTTEIILQPIKLASTGTRYEARLPCGEVLVPSARCPETDACRELLARGITGPFVTRWSRDGAIAMRGDIETMAGGDDERVRPANVHEMASVRCRGV